MTTVRAGRPCDRLLRKLQRCAAKAGPRFNASDPLAPIIRAASIVLELTRVVVLVWRDADLPPSCLSFA